MNYYLYRDNNNEIKYVSEIHLVELYKDEDYKDIKMVSPSIGYNVALLDKNKLNEIYKYATKINGWLPGVEYPSIVGNDCRISLNSEIKGILIELKEVLGYFLITGSGYKWKMGQVIQYNSNIRLSLLTEAMYAYYFITERKMEFVSKYNNLWKDPNVKKIAKSIIDANKQSLVNDIDEVLNSIETVCPEEVNKLETSRSTDKFVWVR